MMVFTARDGMGNKQQEAFEFFSHTIVRFCKAFHAHLIFTSLFLHSPLNRKYSSISFPDAIVRANISAKCEREKPTKTK